MHTSERLLVEDSRSLEAGAVVVDGYGSRKKRVLIAALAMGLLSVGVLLGRIASSEQVNAGTAVQETMDLESMKVNDTSGRKERAYSILQPGPGLKWFDKRLNLSGGWTWFAGNLTVPLSPYSEDERDTPYLDLLVMMVVPPYKDPAKLEPVLHHCGGPGSDALCVTQFMNDEFSNYVGMSISQRGIGTEAQPSFECSPDSMKLPSTGKTQYNISDFTTCECALPDGTPLVGQSFANIDPYNEEHVRLVFEKMDVRAERCATMLKWSLEGPTGKVFNFLEWSGTGMLAFDIEYLRMQIGASRMNINGGSYGTAVGAVYANKFPDRVGKLVLNGNMPPKPETSSFAEGNGWALTQAFAHLDYICAAWSKTFPCNLTQSTVQLSRLFDRLMEDLRSGSLAAPTKLTNGSGAIKMFPLQIGLVGAHLQDQMIGAGFAKTGWTEPVLTIANLAGLQGETQKENQVKTILDKYCRLPRGFPGKSWSGTTTWDNYGVCIGEQSVGLSSRAKYPPFLAMIRVDPHRAQTGGFVNEAAVCGQDYFGRFSVSQAMGIWRQYSRTWGEMATQAFVGIFSEVFAWRPSPTPTHAGDRAGIKALILGNLYDPATSYDWSDQMRESLPNSVMITWQGVGHMTTAGGNYRNSGMKPCLDRVKTYWKSGQLPIDGFTCRQNAPLPV